MQCLRALKEIGYQTGCGFMVGIGPFIPQHDTPFGDKMAGDLNLSVYLLGLLRILLPHALLPATTALVTLHPQGRVRGMLAGANVVMPNLSPQEVRKKYLLYDNKIGTGTEAAESLNLLKEEMQAIVSEVRGTTTDPVSKSMELLPLGPVVIIDTPGIDDEGILGAKRVDKIRQVLNKTDLAVLVVDSQGKKVLLKRK